MSIENQKLEVKAYSTKELSLIYQVSDKTFKKWIDPFMDEIGQKRGRLYTINQVKTIFLKLGTPGTVN